MKLETLKVLASIYIKQGVSRLARILKHMGYTLRSALEVVKMIPKYLTWQANTFRLV
jgi:hypothetical protein